MTATVKTGRVTRLADVKGLMEYRFVPKGWAPPPEFPHLSWFEFDPVQHAGEYAKWKIDISERAARLKKFDGTVWDCKATWFKNGEPSYVARIDYDIVERPVLVVIGGFQ